MRTRVYVAGPITKGDLAHNVNQAREAGIALLRAGYAPLVPHLTCFMGGDKPEVLPHGTTSADWYASDLPWVAVADCVLRLPGESVGADLETGLAGDLGIPVFRDLETLVGTMPSEMPLGRRTRQAA